MSERLVVVVSNSDPRNPCEIVEPIYNATVAASMDYHVEIIFSGRSGEILVSGVAKEVPTLKGDNKTIATLLKEAMDAGVIIRASKHVTIRWGEELIPEVENVVGAGYIISEVMNNAVKTLSY